MMEILKTKNKNVILLKQKEVFNKFKDKMFNY